MTLSFLLVRQAWRVAFIQRCFNCCGGSWMTRRCVGTPARDGGRVFSSNAWERVPDRRSNIHRHLRFWSFENFPWESVGNLGWMFPMCRVLQNAGIPRTLSGFWVVALSSFWFCSLGFFGWHKLLKLHKDLNKCANSSADHDFSATTVIAA